MTTGVDTGGAGRPARLGTRAALASLVAAIAIAVPAALADPGDLDPGFGTDGVVKLPAGDRYQAVDAPLVQASGRIIAAGLLKNSSDRVFLSAVTPTGTTDNSFGTAGTVHTNSTAIQRKAATALAPDGKILVAGGSSSNGKLTIERLTANGAKDNTWGSSGRVTVDLGGAYARVTGLVPVGTTAVLVTAESVSGGRQVFTVAKATTAGLDNTFGTLGISRTPFAGKDAVANDVAILPGGKILLAGAVRATPTSTNADTGLARLNANGLPDSTFGTAGRVTLNLSGGTGEDYAAALTPLADGRIVITGPASGVGMVARLGANGAPDPTFGTGGTVVGGLMASGAGFVPSDVVVEASNRSVIVGATPAPGGTFRWGVVRLRADGTIDGGFGDAGRVVPTACGNAGGAKPTGATLTGELILVLGACDATERTTLLRLIGGNPGPPAGPIDLSVAPDSGAAGHERIPLAGLDPDAAFASAAEAQDTAMRRAAMRRAAMRRANIASTAMRRAAMRRAGLLSTAMRRAALGHALLSEIGLLNTTWQQLLGVDVPLQTLTLNDALDINPAGVGALTLNDIDLNSTAMRRASIAGIIIGVRPLAALPAPAGGWCAFLADQPANCSNGIDPATNTLVDLEVLGDDLSEYYADPISLREVDLGSGDQAAPLVDFLLRDLDLAVDPFRTAEASEFAAILNCGTCSGRKLGELSDGELGGATLGQLIGLLPKPSLQDLSVGDVIIAMLDKSEIPYESLRLDALLGEAAFRTDDLTTYTADFEFDCSQAGTSKVLFHAPGDARPVPGGTTVSFDGGPAHNLGNGKATGDAKTGPFEFDFVSGCSGLSGDRNARMRIVTEPGSVLGPIEGARVDVIGAEETIESNSVITSVDDSRDPGDEPGEARPISEDALLTGHIASSTDNDFFTFTPPAGRSTISLSHLPTDYDLAIYGPEVGPDATAMRRAAMRRAAMRRAPVGDASEEPSDESVVAPDQIQDIAMRRADLAVRGISIKRGDADEAVSVFVRPEEAGTTFVAHVIGYNGGFHEDPYVLRRTDAPAPPLPDCPARPLASGVSIPYPANVPEGTRALYLVDPGRMAARDGEAQTRSLLEKLDVLAERTNGLVIPVQGNPRVATSAAFAAWDANPCSVERANEVVNRINGVVDDVREQGNGLPQLRSITIVGPDDVIPQARIPDLTALGNQADYADDATLDRNGDGVRDDNSVSAAFRFGFMLSDDPLGDFDPTEEVYAPDVALGRLVETASQAEAQVQAFLDSNGTIQPQRAFVTGYDFLTDGAAEIFSTLEDAVPSGSAQSRIDEDWTASDAASGINAPGAGFLSVNAHYDHYRALPAAAHAGTNPDLLAAAATNAPAGSAVFTVGCQSGLNLAVGDASSASDPRLGDWAERMATRGVLYAANTGFGYGDDTAVAYSERIMADYASGLVSGDVTAGQALMLAKQNAFATVGVNDVYWAKASMEATFYGLPMYRLGPDGGEGDSVLPPLSSGGDPTDPTTRSSTPYSADLRGRFEPIEDDRGQRWEIEGHEPLAVLRRPMQPKLTDDVTSDEGPAHGFLMESLTTVDQDGVDPVIVRPTIDLAAHEPEPDTASPFFPATYATVEPQATPEGRRDILTLIAGSFRGDTQRFNLEVEGRILRSSSDDYSPPVIRRVDGLVSQGNYSIRVETEGDDVLGGTVLFITDAQKQAGGETEWHRSDLSLIAPGVLATGGSLPSGTEIAEAIVEVYDRSFNVAWGDHKVVGHSFSPLPQGGEGDPVVVLTPQQPASGYYGAPPQVSLDPGDHDDAIFEVSVDGAAFERYSGPFTIGEPAEGEHLVRFRGSDGSSAASRFAVDREGPTIVAEADRPANANGWYDGPVTFTFTCGDAVSGVADCPDPVTLSESGTNQSVSGTATDRAGHSTTTTVNGINIDADSPTITATPNRAKNANGWYDAPVTFTFTCDDPTSGVEDCPSPLTLGSGENQSFTRTISDRAGNEASVTVSDIDVDTAAPTISSSRLTEPNEFGWYNASGVTIRFTCADDLSGLTHCGTRAQSGAPKSATDEATVTTEGRDQRVTGTATDRAGHSATSQSEPVSIDRTAPTAAITTRDGAILLGAQRLEGTAFDALSRVRAVTVTYTNQVLGTTEQRDADTLSCLPNGDCTWSAPLPPTGLWSASAQSVDFAGNFSPPSGARLISVR